MPPSRFTLGALSLGAGLLATGLLGCKAESRPKALAVEAPNSPIAVGPNVLVSGALPDWEHTEYMADADPRDPQRVLVCSMVFSPARNWMNSALYATVDGGKTWALGLRDSVSPRDAGVWDPACAYGANGDAFFLTLATREAGSSEDLGRYERWTDASGRGYMPIYRSTDGGRTFAERTELGFIDNEDITVDRTGGRYHGRIYVYGNVPEMDKLWLVYSTDGGRRFVRSAATPIKGYDVWHAGQGTVAVDGTLLLPYMIVKDRTKPFDQRGYYTLGVAASTDGGAHIGKPVEVYATYFCTGSEPRGGRKQEIGAITPGMAADHSQGPYRGRVYFLFGDETQGRCGVFLAYSDDQGKSWSDPVKVSDERGFATGGGPDQFLATIAVNKDGVVGVTWYDRREDPRNQSHRLRFSASLDGGQTWLPSVPVSTAPFTFDSVPRYPASAYLMNTKEEYGLRIWPGGRLYDGWNKGMGDYAGIAAGADGRFHAFWIDNRSGVAQMYTAAITVHGAPALHGAAELAELMPISPDSLRWEVTSSVWDPDTRTVTLAYRFVNRSRDTLVAPLKLRVTQVGSDLGPTTLLLDGGRTGGSGTVLDLSVTLPPGGLAPGDTTAPHQVRIRIDSLEGRLAGFLARDIARFNARAFTVKR